MDEPRGRVWFSVQAVLALSLVVSPAVSRRPCPPIVQILGALLAFAGLGLLLASYRTLGGSHSPWTTPAAGAQLVTTGPYEWVRHPVYCSYLVMGLGLELAFGSRMGLLAVVVTFFYYDLRTREEERWLVRSYPAFAAYRARVRGRLVPHLY